MKAFTDSAVIRARRNRQGVPKHTQHWLIERAGAKRARKAAIPGYRFHGSANPGLFESWVARVTAWQLRRIRNNEALDRTEVSHDDD